MQSLHESTRGAGRLMRIFVCVRCMEFFVPSEATNLPTTTRYFVGTAAAVGRYFK